MQIKEKPFYKRPWVYIPFFCVVSTVLTGALCLLLYTLVPAPQPEPTQPPAPTAPLNPYTAESFSYDGYWQCLDGKSVLGIDVSEWQGEIDWQQVSAAGVEFVMLRIGWRGSEQGVLAQDALFSSYYDGAVAAGLQVGGYFFSQATTPEEARQEALCALELVDGRSLSMPIAFDWEYMGEASRTWGMDGQTLTACAKAFCAEIERAGYSPMIYFNPDTSLNLLDLAELADYGFWLAMYEHPMDYPYRVDLWQYTCTGTVPGIAGNVDIDLQLVYE